jgi:hypothetical protein
VKRKWVEKGLGVHSFLLPAGQAGFILTTDETLGWKFSSLVSDKLQVLSIIFDQECHHICYARLIPNQNCLPASDPSNFL